MATDARGHTVPAASDVPSRNTLLNLALSIKDPVPVTNTTTRAAAAAAVSPSNTNPLYTHRADATVYNALEVTTDGATWRTVTASGQEQSWTPTVNAGLTVGNGVWSGGTYELVGNWVTARFTFTLGTTSAVTAGVFLNFPLSCSTTYSGLSNCGSGDFYGGSTATKLAASLFVNTTAGGGNFGFAGPTGQINTTVPFTWATGHILSGTLLYRVA